MKEEIVEREVNGKEYFELLTDIKNQIKKSKTKATISVNTEMILLYYKIGTMIVERNVWGNRFIETLSKDLKIVFPQAKGYSATNLKYMQQFAKEYTLDEIRQRGVGELSWRSNLLLIQKAKNRKDRMWYINKALENNWGKVVLDHQIATNLIAWQGSAEGKNSNYSKTIEQNQSERVLDMLKDPYFIDYVEYKNTLVESQIETLLMSDMSKLLLELGNGFCFKGNQFHVKVGEKDYYIDMLFFNTELKCYVVIELKNEEFKPEFSGQLGFYVQTINEKLRKDYNPTIGILLCRGKDKESVKLSLESINVPVGVAEYKFMNEIPKYLENVIPSIESLESRLNDLENKDN